MLYSELQESTDALSVRLGILVCAGGAVVFAVLLGGRMFLAKSRAELGIPLSLRVSAIGIIAACLLFGLLLNLPKYLVRGPIATVIVVVQTLLIIASLLPLLRVRGSRADGA